MDISVCLSTQDVCEIDDDPSLFVVEIEADIKTVEESGEACINIGHINALLLNINSYRFHFGFDYNPNPKSKAIDEYLDLFDCHDQFCYEMYEAHKSYLSKLISEPCLERVIVVEEIQLETDLPMNAVVTSAMDRICTFFGHGTAIIGQNLKYDDILNPSVRLER